MPQYKLDEQMFGEALKALMLRNFEFSKVDGKDNCIDIHCVSDPEAGLLGRIIMEKRYISFQVEESESIFGGEYILETVKDYLVV